MLRTGLTLLFGGACAAALAPATHAITLADFNADTGVFVVTGDVTSANVSGGELHLVTPGGFRNSLHDTFLPRDGTSTPNVELTASDLRANPLIQWDWRSDDAGSTGDFIGNHLVFNTDVNGHGYRTLTDTFRFIPTNADTTGTHEYDIRTDPVGLAALDDYIAGEGTFFQIFFVQQTSDGTPSATVHYGKFRAVPEPSAAAALAIGGVLALRRRRRR